MSTEKRTETLNWLETEVTGLIAAAEKHLPPATIAERLRELADQYEDEAEA